MKRPLHARTQVQLKKMIRREEGLKTRMSEFVSGSQGGGKDIWDVEYMTTSDEVKCKRTRFLLRAPSIQRIARCIA